MIDLHSHILSGLDDGAPDVATSVEMARMAVADGTTQMACTPHIFPGKYPNSSETIIPALHALQAVLDAQDIPLRLFCGADVHLAPDLIERLGSGDVPTLNNSRYFLLEPPHEILPPKLEDFVDRLLEAGFVPIITHPERLLWVGRHFEMIRRLADSGCPMQVTAGSILGAFGPAASELAHRMLKEDLISFFASDAHGTTWRKPLMANAYQTVAELVGDEQAEQMFVERPAAILANAEPAALTGSGRRAGTRRRVTSDGFAWRVVHRILGSAS
ncbi:tyrosine-protein phosphatase [Manganibacter manganicus]|nr:CpsB/CapC family capsule biosynthesis tyrosine phosphatase [Pseudaminobacter manganicus]